MIRDEDLEFYDEDKICLNCKNWDTAQDKLVLYEGRARFMCQCNANAIEPDAGVAVVLTDGEGHCKNHSQMWEPSKTFMDEVRARMTPVNEINGLTPGVDFPVTLNRPSAA